MTHQGLPAAALPPGPTIYTAPGGRGLPATRRAPIRRRHRRACRGPGRGPGHRPAAGRPARRRPRRGARRRPGDRPAAGGAPWGWRPGRRSRGSRARAAARRTGPQPAGVPAGPQAHGRMPAGLAGAPTDPQIMGMPGPPSGPHPVMSGPPTDPHAVMPGPPTGPPSSDARPSRAVAARGDARPAHGSARGDARPADRAARCMPGVGPPSRPHLARPPGRSRWDRRLRSLPAGSPAPRSRCPGGGTPCAPAGPSALPRPDARRAGRCAGWPRVRAWSFPPRRRGAPATRAGRRGPSRPAARARPRRSHRCPGASPIRSRRRPRPRCRSRACRRGRCRRWACRSRRPVRARCRRAGRRQGCRRGRSGPMPPGPMPQAACRRPCPRPPCPSRVCPRPPMPGRPGDPQFGQRQALPAATGWA